MKYTNEEFKRRDEEEDRDEDAEDDKLEKR